MARTFNGTDDQTLTNSSAPSNFITASAGTIACWYKPVGTPVTNANLFYLPALLHHVNTAAFSFVRGIKGGNDRIWARNYDGAGDEIGVAYSTDVWQHFAWLHTGGNLYIYKNGVSGGSVASGDTVSLTFNSIIIGYNDGSGGELEGDMAELATWNVGLTDAEMLALANGISPLLIRPSARTAYWPLFGHSSPEPCVNNAAFNLTLTLAPAKADHPRIFYPSGRDIYLAGDVAMPIEHMTIGRGYFW